MCPVIAANRRAGCCLLVYRHKHAVCVGPQIILVSLGLLILPSFSPFSRSASADDDYRPTGGRSRRHSPRSHLIPMLLVSLGICDDFF